MVAPEAVKVLEAPLQMLAFEAEMESAGKVLTCTLSVKLELQVPVAPTKLYTVVTLGHTRAVLPVDPELQVYELAPVAVKVEQLPIQMAVGDEPALRVGVGLTFNVVVA